MAKPKYKLCLTLVDTEGHPGDKPISSKILRSLIKEALEGYGFKATVTKGEVVV